MECWSGRQGWDGEVERWWVEMVRMGWVRWDGVGTGEWEVRIGER